MGLGTGGGDFQSQMVQAQQQLMSNPELMSQLMESPLMQSLLANPDTLQSMLTSNPQIQQLMEVEHFTSYLSPSFSLTQTYSFSLSITMFSSLYSLPLYPSSCFLSHCLLLHRAEKPRADSRAAQSRADAAGNGDGPQPSSHERDDEVPGQTALQY